VVQIRASWPAAKIGNVERDQPTDPSGDTPGPTQSQPARSPGTPPSASEDEQASDRTSAAPDADVLAGPDPDVPAPAHTGQDQPVPGRAERSWRDMAVSLLVLLVPIALVFAVYRVVLGGDEPVRVDPAPAVAEARAANAFPVSEPTDLGSGWRPVSAVFQSVDGRRTLRIGYVSPEGRGIQLVQSNVPRAQLLRAELTSSGQAQGVTVVAGRDWQRYSARPGERALVLLEQRRTVIIVGDAAEGELRGLASALR
jgi:Protein of unknown function (DUF4245)